MLNKNSSEVLFDATWRSFDDNMKRKPSSNEIILPKSQL
jgi:hypothetical protein